ncbi:MAG: hypothetical protein JNL74_21745, partial [Fibrobacteres bacterium]|nr:hypothetical protein [Fibrobacterota bacterium]
KFYRTPDDKKGKKTNIHALWDHMVAINSSEIDPNTLSDSLLKFIDKSKIKEYSTGKPSDWAFETYQIARKTVYKGLPAGSYKKPFKLPRDYIEKMRPVAHEQMIKSSLRLKFSIEQLFNPPK